VGAGVRGGLLSRELAKALRKRMTEAERRMEAPPVKSTASGDHPVYALLNPGTSFAGLAQAKTAYNPRLHKPKLHKSGEKRGNGSKIVPPYRLP